MPDHSDQMIVNYDDDNLSDHSSDDRRPLPPLSLGPVKYFTTTTQKYHIESL